MASPPVSNATARPKARLPLFVWVFVHVLLIVIAIASACALGLVALVTDAAPSLAAAERTTVDESTSAAANSLQQTLDVLCLRRDELGAWPTATSPEILYGDLLEWAEKNRANGTFQGALSGDSFAAWNSRGEIKVSTHPVHGYVVTGSSIEYLNQPASPKADPYIVLIQTAKPFYNIVGWSDGKVTIYHDVGVRSHHIVLGATGDEIEARMATGRNIAAASYVVMVVFILLAMGWAVRTLIVGRRRFAEDRCVRANVAQRQTAIAVPG